MSDIVNIGGVDFTIYGKKVDALAHWAAMLGTTAQKWANSVANSPTDIDKALNQATMLLNRQVWIDDVNTFALRDAVVDADNNPLFALASYELAGAILIDPTIYNNGNSGKNVKRVSPERGMFVEFFDPKTDPFPKQVMDYIGTYLAAAKPGVGSGSYAPGTSSTNTTFFPDQTDYDIDRGD